MLINARAKINWTLDITGRREDGYHLMDMLMQPVTLCDTISLTEAETLTLTCGGTPRLTASEDNLALRAAQALRSRTGCTRGAAIHVEKRIPVGAGMGGGSADAAAVLRGLNRLWALNLSERELEEIGLTLGADVPFCLRGGLTRTTGIGERMTALPCGRTWPLVVVQPGEGLSTGAVFGAYDHAGAARRPDTAAAADALSAGDASRLADTLANVLEPVSRAKCPAIGEAIDALKELGAVAALMTGSGSAVFGVFASDDAADDAEEALLARYERVFRCRTAARSAIVEDTCIETARLVIRPLDFSMAAALCRGSQDAQTRRFLPDEVFETEDDAREAIEALTEGYGLARRAQVYEVALRNGDHVGFVELSPTDDDMEIGYQVAEPMRGHGYAAEAVRAFLPVMAARWNLTHVKGICVSDNNASKAVLSASGFTPLGDSPELEHGTLKSCSHWLWKP